MNHYHFSETISNFKSLVYTKLFFPKARLIRRPFYLRGKKSLSFGSNLTCGYGCRFDLTNGNTPTLILGRNIHMGDYVHIVAQNQVSIGDDCLLASKIFISDTNHGILSQPDSASSPLVSPNNRPLETKPVKIGNKVWIGESVSILPGITIGDGCIISAHAVVTKDISAYSMVAGVPAKVIKIYDFDRYEWIRPLKQEEMQ
jgi:acetyltransferase-like isoleucine patch superfamily enzyme